MTRKEMVEKVEQALILLGDVADGLVRKDGWKEVDVAWGATNEAVTFLRRAARVSKQK